MAKLYILGLGVDAEHHATVEVLQAAGECGKVFACGQTPAQLKFLGRFCAKGAVVRVDDESTVLARAGKALAEGQVVGLATPGHPFYWSPLAGRLVKDADAQGIAWKTFGSISPMGVAISAAGVTLGVDVFGLQSFDAGALSSKRAVINPEWPVIVHFYPPFTKADYDGAVARLKSLFGAEHPVRWCMADRSEESTVAALPAAFSKAGLGAVLYLSAKTAPASKVGWMNDSLGKVTKDTRSPEWVKE